MRPIKCRKCCQNQTHGCIRFAKRSPRRNTLVSGKGNDGFVGLGLFILMFLSFFQTSSRGLCYASLLRGWQRGFSRISLIAHSGLNCALAKTKFISRIGRACSTVLDKNSCSQLTRIKNNNCISSQIFTFVRF